MLSIPWFGLAAFVLAEALRSMEVARAAAEQGQFVCGMSALGLEPCLGATVAGIATLFGQRWIVAIVGTPTAAWMALWILGTKCL